MLSDGIERRPDTKWSFGSLGRCWLGYELWRFKLAIFLAWSDRHTNMNEILLNSYRNEDEQFLGVW